MRVAIMLADHAQVADGKLYISGDGWTMGGPGPIYVWRRIAFPHPRGCARTARPRSPSAWPTRTTTTPLPSRPPLGAQPIQIGGTFEVGRPGGVPSGTEINARLPPTLLPGASARQAVHLDSGRRRLRGRQLEAVVRDDRRRAAKPDSPRSALPPSSNDGRARPIRRAQPQAVSHDHQPGRQRGLGDGACRAGRQARRGRSASPRPLLGSGVFTSRPPSSLPRYRQPPWQALNWSFRRSRPQPAAARWAGYDDAPAQRRFASIAPAVAQAPDAMTGPSPYRGRVLLNGDQSRAPVEIEQPVDPQASIEALIVSGQGPATGVQGTAFRSVHRHQPD
jgi:hypothetical protein